MQPVAHEQVQYATLGWRAVAVIIDTLIVLVVSSIVIAVLMAAGVLDLGLSQAATLEDIANASRSAPGWLMPVEYALVFAYFTLFELFGATPGKRAFRMTVLRDDGTRASPTAVVVRNLVRIPEMYLLYLPSAVSCLASGRRKRLGDFAARTVVMRSARVPAAGRGPGAGAAASQPQAAPAVAAVAAPTQPAGPASLDDALATLKTAALTVHGAHLNYLRFSEIELARTEPGRAPHGGEDEAAFSPGYAAAWYTLADAVVALRRAHAAAQAAATRAGLDIATACADQPDLLYLFCQLEPYFAAGSDEDVHEAYLRVARAESAG